MSFLPRSQFQWDEAQTREIFLQNVSFYGGLIFQFPLQQQIGRPFCRTLSKTSAENFSQCSPTLDTTCHLQIFSQLFKRGFKRQSADTKHFPFFLCIFQTFLKTSNHSNSNTWVLCLLLFYYFYYLGILILLSVDCYWDHWV